MWIAAGVGAVILYLASPPFVVSITYVLGIPWEPIRDTFYLPVVVLMGWWPQAIPWYEGYIRLVVSTLRLPAP